MLPMCVPPAQALTGSDALARAGGIEAPMGIGPGWLALLSNAAPAFRGGAGRAAGGCGKGKALAAALAMASAKLAVPQEVGGCGNPIGVSAVRGEC